MIYEDKLLLISSPEKPFTIGHLEIVSKKPFNDLQEDDFAQILSAASYSSNVLFEVLKAHGTNIILTLFDDSVKCDIIARKQDDNLNLNWTPLRPSAQELDEVADRIKDKCDYIDLKDDSNKKTGSENSAPADHETEKKDSHEKSNDWNEEKNYLLKQLDRIP